MATSADDPRTFISQVSLVGRGSGPVKTLGGFDKSRHTVPDAVNPATSSFLARLCAAELAEEAEGFFQAAREALDYKRKDISLDVTSPLATLAAKHFSLELAYALDEADPAAWVLTRTLHGIRDGATARAEAFNAVFAGRFSAVRFDLKKGVRVEAVIDAVEALDADETPEDSVSLRVDYPSDCRECTLTLTGVDAEVVCDGASLEMRFPRAGSPRELLEAFARVRAAFALSKSRPLTGLL